MQLGVVNDVLCISFEGITLNIKTLLYFCRRNSWQNDMFVYDLCFSVRLKTAFSGIDEL